MSNIKHYIILIRIRIKCCFGKTCIYIKTNKKLKNLHDQSSAEASGPEHFPSSRCLPVWSDLPIWAVEVGRVKKRAPYLAPVGRSLDSLYGDPRRPPTGPPPHITHAKVTKDTSLPRIARALQKINERSM